MSLKTLLKFRNTLIFRLTLWYSGVFAVSFLGAFFLFQVLITSVVHERIDQDLLEEAEEFSSLLEVVEGMDEVKTAMLLETEAESSGKVFIRLLDSGRERFASPHMTSWDIEVDGAVLAQLNGAKDHIFKTLPVSQSPYEVRVLYSIIGPGRILQIGQSMEDAEKLLDAFRRVFGITMGFLIPLAALIGWFMARHALSGVEEVTRTAIHISDGKFDRRVPVSGRGEEIDRLATTFNIMVERVHALIKGMREVTDNIAHDLRSPITRIRGVAETTMTTAQGDADYLLMTGSIIEECDRLLGMINTMLDISEAEAGISKLNRSEINTSKIVEEACELFEPIAEGKDIHIIKNLTNHTTAYADNHKLQRVVANLLDNALKYTQTGGTVTISVSEDGGRLLISVEDDGKGISSDDLPRIFERFYRCDPSRSQTGTGLGLSWARAVIQAHGGDITATSTLNEGSTFTVTIPQMSVPAS